MQRVFFQGTLTTATLSDVSVSNNQTHLIEASYTGDDNVGVSRSGTVALTTSQIATTLILRSSSNPVTLTATLNRYSSGNMTTNGEIGIFRPDRT
jgi:hypothetical protein